MGIGVKIAGVGYYVPEKILDNAYFENIVDTNNDWIMQMTGIQERRMAAPEQATSDLGILASKLAMEDAGISAKDIEYVVHHSVTPDMIFPGTSCLIQHALGIKDAGTLDVQAGCTGLIYALSVGYAYIKAGLYKTILVIAGDCLTRITDYEDRNTCVLFGDGACAFVLTATTEADSFKSFYVDGDGSFAELLSQPCSGSRIPATHEALDKRLQYLKMDGPNTFKLAVTAMTNSANKVLKEANMDSSQIDWLIPHQANMRIMESVAKKLKISEEKVVKTIHKYGNTSATTLGIAFAELVKEGKIKRGDNIVFVSFGAGATWGATLFQY